MDTIFRPYGQEASIYFGLKDTNGKLVTGISFATGDVTVSLDGASEVNTTNLPVPVGKGYNLTLTAAEITSGQIRLTISDATPTQLWVDTYLIIETYGDVSSEHHAFPSNITQVNNDTLPASNLKLQYDGTGLTGDNFPSSQGQVDKISVSSGLINKSCDSYTLTTGTVVSGDFTDTFTVDGVEHRHEDDSGSLDVRYNFNVGTNSVAASVEVVGRINGGNDTLDGIYAWNWTAADWSRIGDYVGKGGSGNDDRIYPLDISNTGSGADAGKVIIRLARAAGLTDANLYIDRISTAFTSVLDSAFILHSGIAQGGGTNYIDLDVAASNIDDFYIHSKVIITSGTGSEQENIITSYDSTIKRATVKDPWFIIPNTTSAFNIAPAHVHCSTSSGGYDNSSVYIDVSDGVAGTQIGVNGTSENPSNNFIDARAIADSVNIKSYIFNRGTGLPNLSADHIGWRFEVRSATAFTLDSPDVGLSVFSRAALFGTALGTSGLITYEDCGLFDFTTDRCNFVVCAFSGTITLTSTGKHTGVSCTTNEDALQTPIIDINGDGVTPTTLNLLPYDGKLQLNGMTSVDEVVITGNCLLTIDSSCIGGTLTYSGDIKVSGAGLGNLTIINGNIKDIKDDSADTQTKVNTIISDVGVVDDKVDTTITNTVNIETKVDDVLEDTSTTLPALITTLIGDLENLSAAEVKTEVVNALSVDTTVEATSVPSPTASISSKLSYLFAYSSNKIIQTSTEQTLRNNADTSNVSVSNISKDATSTTKDKAI